MTGMFSDKEIDGHVKRVEKQPGHTLDVGVELEPGQARPETTVEYQGEHDGEKVDVTWGAWAKTQWSKATTAVGAKFGFKF